MTAVLAIGGAVAVTALATTCPGRLGDDADWCDTRGGTTATCTICDQRVTVTSWTTPTADVTLWIIGPHTPGPVT